MKIRNLTLLALLSACSSAKNDKKINPTPSPSNPIPHLGFGEIKEIHGTWALRNDDWTKVIYLPEISGGEGVVQIYYQTQLRAEASFNVDWKKEAGTLSFTANHISVNVDGRYLCGKNEVWKVNAYDPTKHIDVTADSHIQLVTASCFGNDFQLSESRDLVYRRFVDKELIGSTCSIPGQDSEVCKLKIDAEPTCSEEFSKSIMAGDEDQELITGRWFQITTGDQVSRCRVLPKNAIKSAK